MKVFISVSLMNIFMFLMYSTLPGKCVDGWKLEDSGGRGEQKAEGWGNWAFKINKQEKKLG